MVLIGKIRPDKSTISLQSLCLEWHATEAARILKKSAPLARSWQSLLFKSEIEILNDLKRESIIVNPQQRRIFFGKKKVSESDYWFRVLIVNLFVPLRLLIKPQGDTARMFHMLK